MSGKVLKVYIDIGHGGYDPGAVYGSLLEKSMNLTTGLAAGKMLAKYGVMVKYSRTTDKFRSLNAIALEANSWGADLVISVHYNAGKGDGWEAIVTHAKNISKGDDIALVIEKHIKSIGQNSRGIKTRLNSKGLDYFGIIRMTNAPAIILEGGFIDNATDSKLFDSLAEQRKIGEAYAAGILDYYNIKTPVNPSPSPSKDPTDIQEDGKWGTATTSLLQRKMGTIVDGEIWHQLLATKQYHFSMYSASWKYDNTRKGSMVIKALQEYLNEQMNIDLVLDGLFGYETVGALQKFLKVGVDHEFGIKSVTALQVWLNK